MAQDKIKNADINSAAAIQQSKLALANDLLAVENLATTGLATRTATDTWTTRTITGTANELTVSNGDGVAGNPTLSLPAALTYTGKTVTGGTFNGGTYTINDSTFTLQDEVDNTKKAQFQLSGLTTATTFTFTLPAVTAALATLGNIAQTFSGSTTFGSTFSTNGTSSTLGAGTNATTTNVGTGATTTGVTKAINVGTGGLSGSTTNIIIGNATAGATSTTTLNGSYILTGEPTPAFAAGKLAYDTTEGTLAFYNANSAIKLLIGEEEWVKVINNSGVTIANGAAVYINGASGTLPTVALARADAIATAVCIGLATEAIANGATGRITNLGVVNGLDTSALTAAPVYLSAVTAGALTQTPPAAPNYRVKIGDVAVVSASVGKIQVTPFTPIPQSTAITPSALTKTDDTNVTLTLGGTPATALLQPASITVGWAGQLSVARGGSGAATLTGVLKGNGTSAFSAATAGTDYSAGTSALATGILKSTTTTGALTIAVAADFPTLNQNTTGNAATVTTNANLTGVVTSVGNATSLGSFTSAQLAGALTDETGTGAAVFATSPTLVTPALGTPSALVGTNITGTAASLTAGNVTTNANMTGVVTSVGNTTSFGSFASSALATAVTDETGTGSLVFATSPTLVTPNLGTPSAATLTSATGLPIATGVSGLATGIATFLATPTSANLAAAVTNETGTGLLVFNASPALTTPAFTGVPTGTITSGSYTPTLTNVTNITSSVAYPLQWMRVGNVITVSGGVEIQATAGTAGTGTATEIGISLPVASTFTAVRDVGGNGTFSTAVQTRQISALADTTNLRARLNYNSNTAGTVENCQFIFMYTVK